jgi:DNA-binding transcriptional LysR family regulator
VPTPAGIDLTEVAEATERAILRAEGRVKGLDDTLQGALRLSTLDWIFEAYAHVLASFCARYPGVSLTVLTTGTEVSLFRREADVVLRLTNTPPETLVGRRLTALPFAVYGHERLVTDPSAPWEDYPWLHWDERTEMARWLDAWLKHHAPGARVTLRTGEDTLVRRAALQQGIGVHPLPVLEGDRIPELVRIGPVLDAFTRDLWLLTLPALRLTRRVRALLDHVSEALHVPP